MALYRTWRPPTFEDLVGQEAVVRTLVAAITSGRIAHAYLFSGPRGSGKTSAAKILARCLNCANGPTATPDNTCEFCREMLAGTAIDVLEIDAASNRGIDDVRSLREAVKFGPSSMRMKIYIIDEAHMLTKEGANAFLKTLEEPPANVVFILATTEPEKLPVTVLSRCQRYAFRRIAIPAMIEKMREIAAGEGIAIDDEALATIAYRADGGLRDALTVLEQAAAFAGGETVTVSTLDSAFGSSGRAYAQRLLEAAIARDGGAALAAIEEASDAGSDLTLLIRSLTAAFRNVLIAHVDRNLLARDLAPEDAATAVEQAQRISQPALIRGLRALADAATLARTGGNARLELETALLRYMLVENDAANDTLAERVTALEAQLGAGRPPASSAPAPSAPAPSAPPAPKAAARPKRTGEALGLQQVRAAWQSIRGKVEGERQSLRAPLSRAQIDALESNALVLKLPDAWSADALRDHLPLLEAAVADVLGTPLRVTVRVDGASRAKGSAPGGVASVTGDAQTDAADAPDALFSYASERIR